MVNLDNKISLSESSYLYLDENQQRIRKELNCTWDIALRKNHRYVFKSILTVHSSVPFRESVRHVLFFTRESAAMAY